MSRKMHTGIDAVYCTVPITRDGEISPLTESMGAGAGSLGGGA